VQYVTLQNKTVVMILNDKMNRFPLPDLPSRGEDGPRSNCGQSARTCMESGRCALQPDTDSRPHSPGARSL
jgi:hypothetical protein